jgi:hypothetical protein
MARTARRNNGGAALDWSLIVVADDSKNPGSILFPESGLLCVPFRGRAKSVSFNRQPSAAIPIEVSSIAIHVAILTAQFPVLMAGGGIVTAVEIAAQLAAIM